MTSSWLVWFVSFLVSTQASEGFRRTAPTYLTSETALLHLAAAEVATVTVDYPQVTPARLLSVGWHESRFQVGVVTPEHDKDGRWIGNSCGVMTPEPKLRCDAADFDLVGGYVRGAQHMAGWFRACHDNVWCAFTGYAGGYALIARCQQPDAATDYRCGTWAVFEQRAKWIEREMQRALPAPRSDT